MSNPQGINQYTKKGGGAKKQAKIKSPPRVSFKASLKLLELPTGTKATKAVRRELAKRRYNYTSR